ncbi:MAG TPA: hypothetical protein VEL07_01325 [Planctomycetota bacterium]|nr:hypothetical protein [Planctomycetota bacterium]
MSAARTSGSILVVVAGLCALLSAMSLAFVMRMRSDAEEANRMSQDIQSRVMLTSALMYVQEAGRIGWHPTSETFGWRDIRDGMAGPRVFDGTWPPILQPVMKDDGTALSPSVAIFPAIGGRAARSPMFVMRRPPFAIRSTIAPNPVPLTDPNDDVAADREWHELVNYANHDPFPVIDNAAQFRDGDRAPMPAAGIASWFRVYRKDVATFTITCGAGATQGFKDWQEVADTPGAAEIFGSREEFEAIRTAETRRWYEAEWSDLVTGNNFMHGHYARHNTRIFGGPTASYEETPNMRQQTGTFTYIASIPEPTDW